MKFKLFAVLFCSVTGLTFGQLTNSIPPHLYPTDDGHLFWFQRGQQVVSEKKIKEAEESTESRPSEQDPDGHWNGSPDGFQISLRFKKYTFANGEPIAATMLMRNVTNQPLTYYRPLFVAVEKDGVALKRKGRTEEQIITTIPSVTIFPQTQQRYEEDIAQVFDLTNGQYTVRAECRQPKLVSQAANIVITNPATALKHE